MVRLRADVGVTGLREDQGLDHMAARAQVACQSATEGGRQDQVSIVNLRRVSRSTQLRMSSSATS